MSPKIPQNELDAAARGLKMYAMAPSELDTIATRHDNACLEGVQLYMSVVIATAARQLAAVKRLNGAEG